MPLANFSKLSKKLNLNPDHSTLDERSISILAHVSANFFMPDAKCSAAPIQQNELLFLQVQDIIV